MVRFLSRLLLGLCAGVCSPVVVLGQSVMLLLLFAFQSMFISIRVSRLEIAEFPDSVRRSAP